MSARLAGTVAVVGFPNVGKSTLVNRLSDTRETVVHEQAGVTRDRKEVVCEWQGTSFALIDTGGVDIADATPMTRAIVSQARAAIEEADVVLFVVDAQRGPSPGDEEIAQILRASRRPVLVIANKIDDASRSSEALEFHRLGLGEPIPISALHGLGTGDLLDLIVEQLPGTDRVEPGDEAIRVAILGRPNVGKSSLLNALLGQERVIVSETPGTTRDAIDTTLERDGTTLVLVDTAGVRRKRRHRQGIEYFSELRTRRAAERADIALVLIDSSEGIVEHDLTIADIARRAGCSTLVVLAKWDVTSVTIEEARARVHAKLRQRPQLLAVSALTGRGLERLLDAVEELFERRLATVGTSELNELLGELRDERPGPSKRGTRLRLKYGTQTGVRPPRFRVFVNDGALMTRDYAYWLENRLRERLGLTGTPLIIDFVGQR